jgi:hypothetical protein
MFISRRLSLAVSAFFCLLLAGAAAADPVVVAAVNGYTAAATPSHVKPATSASYTVKLTNDPSSASQADRARIGIPASFGQVAGVQATTSAAGACQLSTWSPSPTAPAGTIELVRPGGNDQSLCPGATLTVVFSATSAPTQGTYTWMTGLFRGPDTIFELQGSQPTVVVDGTAPQVTITQKPSNPSNVRSPSFTFAVSESATLACRLDAGAFAPCVSPATYSNLADGPHTFLVRATDAAGNAGPQTSYTWTIDTVAPTVVITQKPSNPASTSSATFAFTASQNGSSFSCRLDEGGFVPCSSPWTYSNLSDGPHIFSVKATDPAGNAGPDVAYGWTIETRAPTASVTLAPAGLSNSRAPTFGFAADEPSTFECKQDDGGFAPCTSPASYAGLADGAHVFSVRARDAVGNMSVPVSHAWTIDATAPETTLTAAPTSGTATSATFAFAANEGGTFECRIDSAPFTLCGSPKSYGGLSRGDHQFQVRAIDAAGNVDATPSLHGWKIAAPAAKKAASALLSPKAGARVTRAPLLVWRRVSRASYYNVQIFRGKRKVLSAWPTRTRLQLRARWKYLGRNERLTPGRYRWFVWPGYGNPRRYGSLLGQSSFVVGRAVRR